MDSLKNENIKSEQVCRTCLIDEGHFFNISDTFDHYTLTQMIQNITNLQIHPTDRYTQFICFECVKELRRANKFRAKCLESYNTLFSVVPISICEIELSKYVQEMKQEVDESCNIREHNLKTKDNCKSSIPDAESSSDNDEYNEKIGSSENESGNRTKTIFDCPLCHGLFYKDNVYQKHIKEFHPERLNDDCFKEKRESLGYILKEKHSNKTKCTYKCAADEFIGNTFIELKNHMKKHLGEKPIFCADCGFRTTEVRQLKKHRLQKHVEEKQFYCSFCDYSCQSKSALKVHLPIHTLEKNYECKLCSVKFKFQSSLSNHKKVVHENRKSHICSICQKAFFHSYDMKSHMLTHSGARPHLCQYCGKGFSTIGNRRTHEKLRHEPIKTLFKCEICDYNTKVKSELINHMKRHFGEKPFKCPECSYSAVLKSTLKLHMMKHSGETKFACDFCDYKSVMKSSLVKHRRIHTGEKPYSCTICSYSGTTSQQLKTHMQTHNSEQKFKCPNCPYKTNVKDYLTRHLKKNCTVKKCGRSSMEVINIPENILMDGEIIENTSIKLSNIE